MDYLASLSDFFKSPKWINNLLLGGVCILIPIVGPIVLMGWHVSAFWGRPNPQDFTTYPNFDFSNFGKYLERGIWPFLAMMVLSLVMVPVMIVMMFITIPLIVASQGDGQGHEAMQAASILSFVGLALVSVIMVAVMMMVMRPLSIAASITQDFASAFQWRRLKNFVRLVWPEMLLSAVFMWVASLGLMLVGMVAVCFGLYFAMALIYFVHAHLDWQLYQLYVARGGEPIARSAKFNEGPPALPPALQ